MRSWVPLGVVAAGLAVAPAAQASPSREAEYARLLATLSSAEPAEREELVRAQVLPDVISRLIVVDASLTRPDAAEAKLDALGPFDDAPMAVRIYVQGLRCTLAGHRGRQKRAAELVRQLSDRKLIANASTGSTPSWRRGRTTSTASTRFDGAKSGPCSASSIQLSSWPESWTPTSSRLPPTTLAAFSSVCRR